MGKVIAVVSGKGGTGKTTTVGAIGSCLAAMGHKTLCVDCDAGLRNLDVVLGMSDYTVADFTDVASGTLPLMTAASEHPSIEKLFFISAPAVATVQELDPEIMKAFAEQTRAEFEFTLLDAAAGIGAGFRLAVAGADSAIIVTTGDMGGIRGAQKVTLMLNEAGISDIRLVVNRVEKKKFSGSGLTVDDIIDTVGAQLIGLIYEDPAVSVAANKETALVLYEGKRAAVQYLRAAQRLLGEKPKVPPESAR